MNKLSIEKVYQGSILIFLMAILLNILTPSLVKSQSWVEKPGECCPCIDEFTQCETYNYSISLQDSKCKVNWKIENGYIKDENGNWVTTILNSSSTQVTVKWQNVAYDNVNKKMPKGIISVKFEGENCGALKDLDVTILSLNNFPPDPFLYPIINNTITWVYGVTPPRTTLSIPKMIFPNSSKNVNDY